MKHRTKLLLILLYTVLTVASVAWCISPMESKLSLLLVWPELLTFVHIAGWEELTALGVLITCALSTGMLLHAVAPVCGFFRLYWPFKALLGVKATLNLAVFMLLPGVSSGLLLLLHGAPFVLAVIFFRREGTEAASDGTHGDTAPEEKRLVPSPGLHMPGSGFPDR